VRDWCFRGRQPVTFNKPATADAVVVGYRCRGTGVVRWDEQPNLIARCGRVARRSNRRFVADVRSSIHGRLESPSSGTLAFDRPDRRVDRIRHFKSAWDRSAGKSSTCWRSSLSVCSRRSIHQDVFGKRKESVKNNASEEEREVPRPRVLNRREGSNPELNYFT